mmetsp:Transcript_31761/g.72939  ORF Transcript_31761/g.72939 Transcript_31761/m.72939 type:complete len:353 (-) Transcript_31761:1214-2272(-)
MDQVRQPLLQVGHCVRESVALGAQLLVGCHQLSVLALKVQDLGLESVGLGTVALDSLCVLVGGAGGLVEQLVVLPLDSLLVLVSMLQLRARLLLHIVNVLLQITIALRSSLCLVVQLVLQDLRRVLLARQLGAQLGNLLLRRLQLCRSSLCQCFRSLTSLVKFLGLLLEVLHLRLALLLDLTALGLAVCDLVLQVGNLCLGASEHLGLPRLVVRHDLLLQLLLLAHALQRRLELRLRNLVLLLGVLDEVEQLVAVLAGLAQHVLVLLQCVLAVPDSLLLHCLHLQPIELVLLYEFLELLFLHCRELHKLRVLLLRALSLLLAAFGELLQLGFHLGRLCVPLLHHLLIALLGT